ncbi:MAG: DNA polymerase III subunit beta [Oscillospiraceae bacterium]|nr:DNA polymerase III subunit beta [Oscillospiraceae bacterium]
MKFKCSTAQFSDVCQNVQRAISSRTTMPALEGILIQAQDGKLFLTGYDLEVGIQTSIEAEIKEEGALVLNARILCDILRKIPVDTVELQSDSRFLANIKGGESRYKINGISSEEYPELPSISGGAPLVVGLGVLREMIKQTIFAVAINPDTKPVHSGVKFEVSEGRLRLAAIDGFRLALRTEPIAYEGQEVSFVVPPKTLNELLKISVDEASEVSISVGKRHIVFDVGVYHVVSRLLDGEFMNYAAAVPAQHKTEAAINTHDFIAAIERISLIITEKIKSPVRCTSSPEEGRILLSCQTGLGTADDSVSADLNGDGFEVGFNNRFLLDALRAADTDEILLRFSSVVLPIVILPPEGDRFLYMVLPVRLKADK